MLTSCDSCQSYGRNSCPEGHQTVPTEKAKKAHCYTLWIPKKSRLKACVSAFQLHPFCQRDGASNALLWSQPQNPKGKQSPHVPSSGPAIDV